MTLALLVEVLLWTPLPGTSFLKVLHDLSYNNSNITFFELLFALVYLTLTIIIFIGFTTHYYTKEAIRNDAVSFYYAIVVVLFLIALTGVISYSLDFISLYPQYISRCGTLKPIGSEVYCQGFLGGYGALIGISWGGLGTPLLFNGIFDLPLLFNIIFTIIGIFLSLFYIPKLKKGTETKFLTAAVFLIFIMWVTISYLGLTLIR